MKTLAAALLTFGLVLPAAARTIKGTVQESLPAGTYTYLLIKTPAGEEWAAVNKTALKKGAAVEVTESTVMEDFKSPTLNRSFKKIVFGVIDGNKASVLPAGHGAAGMPPVLPPSKAQRPKGEPLAVSVADAYARRKELAGKLVSVRGKVVKSNANIMGKNWFHIQDGSGDAKAGTHDLTVTTTGTAAKGSEVLAVGVLAADQDLGSGYAYAALLEEAELKPAR